MAVIPLNKFVRTSVVLGLSSPSLSAVYTVPYDRASIILTAQATNTSPVPHTASMFIVNSLSAKTFVGKDIPIAPNDAVNMVLGKLVATDLDQIYAYTNSADDSVYFTLSILETINTTS